MTIGFDSWRKCAAAALLLVACAALLSRAVRAEEEEEEGDPPEIAVGERLFLETRFAQFFFANCNGDVNAVLPAGDPSVAKLQTLSGPIDNALGAQTMSCRQCHLVDDAKFTPGGGNRTYADFARRSPIPLRDDGLTLTARNSPSLVNAQISRKNGFFLHFDGEFGSVQDLAKGTYTGRNFGWLASEQEQAIAHIANVIRKDDGSGQLAKDFGGPYRLLLKGGGAGVPDELQLGSPFAIDVSRATDRQIFNAVTRLVAEYVKSLTFAMDENGEFVGSSFDLFMQRNKLPTRPRRREAPQQYGARLIAALDALGTPKYVTPADGTLLLHNNQPLQFGPEELAGLKIFLSAPDQGSTTAGANCIACHAPPFFTDFKFHNTGATQDEYDALHGDGAFMALPIPSQSARLAAYDSFLPPTPFHPNGNGRFAAVPDAADANKVDLGLWNVYGNPDHKTVQRKLKKDLVAKREKISVDDLVDRSIAVFKTPGLRDLGHSAPYFHTGQKDTLEQAVRFYQRFSALARDGQVRNADPEIPRITLNEADIEPLVKFLRALNEDYE
jgi:hypothetical protein